MKTEMINNDGHITIMLDGWLDTLAAPELGAAFEAINEAQSITLDFEKVEYIASSGLRQVVAGHRKAKELNAEYSVINVCEKVMSILQMTGLEQKINIR